MRCGNLLFGEWVWCIFHLPVCRLCVDMDDSTGMGRCLFRCWKEFGFQVLNFVAPDAACHVVGFKLFSACYVVSLFGPLSLSMSLSGLCLSGVFDRILGMCPIKKHKPKSGNDDFLICMATSLYCPFEKE